MLVMMRFALQGWWRRRGGGWQVEEKKGGSGGGLVLPPTTDSRLQSYPQQRWMQSKAKRGELLLLLLSMRLHRMDRKLRCVYL